MAHRFECGGVSAADAGAPHLRERIWIVASHTLRCRYWDFLQQVAEQGCSTSTNAGRNGEAQPVADVGRARLPQPECQELCGARRRHEGRAAAQFDRWPAEPGLVRVVHGAPNRLDRIRALGNAQVPRVASAAWALLSE